MMPKSGDDMYQLRYEDVMNDDMASAKDRERMLFDRSIDMLAAAKVNGAGSREGIDAGYFTMRLWTTIIDDLGSEENALPKELKAAIISIGIFVLKELERIRQGESNDYDTLIDITRSIRDGL
jgi:flagellar protein FlaF